MKAGSNGNGRNGSNGKPTPKRCGDHGGVRADGSPCRRFMKSGPCQHHGGPNHRTAILQGEFLAALSQTGNISKAAEIAGQDRKNKRVWLEKDPTFQARYDAAMDAAADRLEAVADDRAVKGLRQYKFHQGRPLMMPCSPEDPEAVELIDPEGEPVFAKHYYEHLYSDQLLMFLLNGMRPEKYVYRHRHEHSGSVALTIGDALRMFRREEALCRP